MFNQARKVAIISCLLGLALSCAKVPITGRKQLKLLPESEIMASSLTSYKEFLSTNKVINTGVEALMVKRVGDKIARAVTNYLSTNNLSDRVKGYNWEFNLVNDNTVNAWCMPGGKVVFYTGIIPVCKTEAGLAVVMGHEIAHAIAQHGNERMSQGLAEQFGGLALQQAIANKPKETQNLINLAYGAGTQIGVMLPFSRLHETEADELGLYFMAMAGYDPKEAAPFWQRMNTSGGARPPQFLSTHPNPNTRIANIQKWMPKAEGLYQQNKGK